jgi:hypothetical protein
MMGLVGNWGVVRFSDTAVPVATQIQTLLTRYRTGFAKLLIGCTKVGELGQGSCRQKMKNACFWPAARLSITTFDALRPTNMTLCRIESKQA